MGAIPAGAKAPGLDGPRTARLKSCPFQPCGLNGSAEAEPFQDICFCLRAGMARVGMLRLRGDLRFALVAAALSMTTQREIQRNG